MTFFISKKSKSISMPKASISIGQSKINLKNFVEGADLFTGLGELTEIENALIDFIKPFQLKVNELLAARGNVASGKLGDSIEGETFTKEGEATLQIKVLDYFDYPNEGVQGVMSSKNATASPYKYKNFGVPETMKQSLKQYIQSGKAKISSVRNDKALGIGNEKKSVNLLDAEVDTLGFLIKAFGIKASHYFTDAMNESIKDFEPVLAEAVGRDIIIGFTKIKR
jgi:hypothetical protein